MLGHAEITSQNSLGGSCSQQDDYFRLHNSDLGIQPGTAGRDLRSAGLLMNAALAARLPLEMLHNVGYVHVFAVNTGFSQSFIQHRACRSHKWPSGKVFFISRLLAYHHHSRAAAAFTEDGLCAQLPQV